MQNPGATLPAVPKNLVIVESPAKARTIERYLGDDYRVLASYGHVRDLPENPGKGKFGVDVDHDFAPEYVVSDDRRKQVAEITKAAKSADTVFLATDLDREGEAIAWHVAEAAHDPAVEDPAGHLQRDHRGRDPRGVRPSARHRHEPRRRPAGPPDRRPPRRLHAEPAAVAEGPVGPVGRPRPVGRRPARRRAGAGDRRVHRAASTGRSRRSSRRPTAPRSPRSSSGSTASRRSTMRRAIGDGDTADVHAAMLRTLKPEVTKVGTRKQTRSPAPPFTTSTLQQEASRKLGFSPKRTMSVAQRLYEGVDTPDGHVGLITYMRTDSTAIAGVAMGEARDVIRDRFGEPYTMPKGRVYKTKSKGAQEAHESIRPTSFRRDPDSLAGSLKPEELRLYRLIWQRAIASQMAAKELETTTVDLAAGAVRAAGERDEDAVRRLLARSTPRAATTAAEDEEERAPAAARRGRRHDRRGRHARPSTSRSRRRASPRRR